MVQAPGEATPMLLLRAGAEGASSAGACDVAAVVGHAKAYLIGSPYTGPGPEPSGAILQVGKCFWGTMAEGADRSALRGHAKPYTCLPHGERAC